MSFWPWSGRSAFLVGQVIPVLQGLPARSVHCVVTSPPYFGLRDYGLPPFAWADGWNGCLGLEPTPEAFVEHIGEVFDEIVRVLRPDGTAWLNLGDCFAGGGRAGKNPEYMARHTEFGKPGRGTAAYGIPIGVPDGLKRKDLVGIPWRVAFALQARGWYLRAAIPWIRRNVIPSSTRDRPTSATETVFLLAHPESGGRYFYDVTATRLAASQKPQRRAAPHKRTPAMKQGVPAQTWSNTEGRDELGVDSPGGMRQRRDTDWFFDSLRELIAGGEALLHAEADDEHDEVVSADHEVPIAVVVNPRPFAGAHFAVYPEVLVAPMILASTSERGVCAECGVPWVRQVERTSMVTRPTDRQAQKRAAGVGSLRTALSGTMIAPPTTTTTGWASSCSCAPAEPVPAVVLDPFGGAGTTSLAAWRLDRRSIYIDASAEYRDMAVARLREAIAKSA